MESYLPRRCAGAHRSGYRGRRPVNGPQNGLAQRRPGADPTELRHGCGAVPFQPGPISRLVSLGACKIVVLPASELATLVAVRHEYGVIIAILHSSCAIGHGPPSAPFLEFAKVPHMSGHGLQGLTHRQSLRVKDVGPSSASFCPLFGEPSSLASTFSQPSILAIG